MPTAALIVALVALALLLANWVGYPLVVAAIARRRRAEPPAGTAGAGGADTRQAAPVTVVIATRDQPDVLVRRVDNILSGDYPAGLVRVIVALDAQAAVTVDELQAALGDRATVLRGDAPGGKAAALNAGVRAATTELLVLADSHQTFNAPAIGRLVRFLDDQRYGAVSGAVHQQSGDRIVDLYWRYELLIRRGQTAIHSIVSTSGQICGMRRSLWTPLPAGLICDDLYVTMQLVLRGYRVGFCEGATATDPRSFTKPQHFQRKVRTLTGLFQFVSWMPAVLVPGRNPIWIHFVFHKLMRFVTPYLLLLAAAGLAVAGIAWYPRAVGAAVVLAAAIGLLAAVVAPRRARRVGGQLAWLCKLQAVPLIATANGLRGRWEVWHFHQPLQRG